MIAGVLVEATVVEEPQDMETIQDGVATDVIVIMIVMRLQDLIDDAMPIHGTEIRETGELGEMSAIATRAVMGRANVIGNAVVTKIVDQHLEIKDQVGARRRQQQTSAQIRRRTTRQEKETQTQTPTVEMDVAKKMEGIVKRKDNSSNIDNADQKDNRVS